mgnify:CR=1 FL=1
MLVLRILAVTLALPWMVVVAVGRFVLAALKLPWQLRAKSADVLLCGAGHANPTHGRWTCGCGAVYLGHAFAPCPICGMPAGWVKCETCGLAIRSPWKDS